MNSVGNFAVRCRRHRFDFHAQNRQRTGLVDFHSIFGNFAKPANNIFQGAGIKIVSPQMHHVIGPAQYAPRQP